MGGVDRKYLAQCSGRYSAVELKQYVTRLVLAGHSLVLLRIVQGVFVGVVVKASGIFVVGAGRTLLCVDTESRVSARLFGCSRSYGHQDKWYVL